MSKPQFAQKYPFFSSGHKTLLTKKELVPETSVYSPFIHLRRLLIRTVLLNSVAVKLEARYLYKWLYFLKVIKIKCNVKVLYYFNICTLHLYYFYNVPTNTQLINNFYTALYYTAPTCFDTIASSSGSS